MMEGYVRESHANRKNFLRQAHANRKDANALRQVQIGKISFLRLGGANRKKTPICGRRTQTIYTTYI